MPASAMVMVRSLSRPPKEYQFKPGQSGNPKGPKRKPKPMAPDLKAALERALHEPIKLKQGVR
jgi:Family of unknown function (DUF5681)